MTTTATTTAIIIIGLLMPLTTDLTLRDSDFDPKPYY